MTESKKKLSNLYNEKKFSSANLAFIAIVVLTIAIGIYQGIKYVKNWSLLGITFLIFFMTNIIILTIKKFPVFVNCKHLEKKDLENCGEMYEKNIVFLSRLYFMMFTSEPSCFVSLFSPTKLTLYKQEKDNTFIWHSGDRTKLIHRVLDFVFMVSAILFNYVLITYCIKTAIMTKALILVLAIVTLAFKLEKTVLCNMFSVKVEEKEGIKLKLLYNYSSSKILFNNFYGTAEPWTKSVIIGSNDMPLNIKEFIIAHEIGHIKDKKFIFMNTFMMLFEVIYIFGLLFVLDGANQNRNTILVLISAYFIYWLALKYIIHEKSEFFADKYVADIIGKEKYMEAMNIMNKKDTKLSSKVTFLNLVTKMVPVNRRIEVISNKN